MLWQEGISHNLAICFVSLREMLMAISYEVQARQDGATEEEEAL